MGSIKSVCCEPAIQPGFLDYRRKEHKFESFDGEPKITNQRVLERIKEFGREPIYVKPQNHPHATVLMPMRELNNGFIYCGEWINNKPDGFGKIYFPNEDYFEGEFYEGQARGVGRLYYNDGSFFEGEIEQNAAKGKGKYISKGVNFVGDWVDSQPKTGTYYLEDGTQIEVDRSHHGFIKWKDGRLYEGDLDANMNPDGQGRMRFPTGNQYNGKWSKGLINGFGTYTWADGRRYEGFYQNSSKEGAGTFYYNKDERYEGEWKHGKQEGKGKLFKNDKVVYDGLFKNGHPVQDVSQIKSQQIHVQSNPWQLPSQPNPWQQPYNSSIIASAYPSPQLVQGGQQGLTQQPNINHSH